MSRGNGASFATPVPGSRPATRPEPRSHTLRLSHVTTPVRLRYPRSPVTEHPHCGARTALHRRAGLHTGFRSRYLDRAVDGAWRSPVARLLWEPIAGRSGLHTVRISFGGLSIGREGPTWAFAPVLHPNVHRSLHTALGGPVAVAAFGHAMDADKDGAQTPWFGLHHAKLFRIRFRRILKHAARRDSGAAGQG